MRSRLVVAGLLLSPAGLAGQHREIQRHPFASPEGRLMGFYAAAVAFSAVGPGDAGIAGELTGGLELSYLPRLSRAQRSAGFDKPESSNLSPLLPRPRLALSTPGGIRIEGTYLPPVRVFGARAHLYSIAVSRAVLRASGVGLTARLAATGGSVSGPITCDEELARGTPSEALYFAAVCHGRESDDHFEPRQLSGELLMRGAPIVRGIVPYAGVGARYDDVRFDIGVLHTDGRRDLDHPILTMRATRPFFLAGATLSDDGGRSRVAAEMYYAPGSLLTGRVRAELRLRRGGRW